jgi:hypothetical protein
MAYTEPQCLYKGALYFIYYGCKRWTLNNKSEMVNYLFFIYYYLLQLNFHSVAAVLTLVQTKNNLKETY